MLKILVTVFSIMMQIMTHKELHCKEYLHL